MDNRMCTYCEKIKPKKSFEKADLIPLDSFEVFSTELVGMCDACLETYFIFDESTKQYKEVSCELPNE